MKAKIDGTRVVFGPCRLTYAHLFTPQAGIDGGAAKYSTGVLIDKNDKDTIAALNKACEAAKEIAKNACWKGSMPKKLDSILRDGDEKDPADAAYEGHYYINAKCKTRPGVIDRNNNILTEGDIKSGDYAYVSVSIYGYSVNGNKGLGVGLNNVMKQKDGDPLGGRMSAESDFGGCDLDDEEEDL